MTNADLNAGIIEEINVELARQEALAHGGDTEEFDRTNGQGDWVAYVCSYIGRASVRVFRNKREGHTFRVMMIKGAALCIAALRAPDKGYCPE